MMVIRYNVYGDVADESHDEEQLSEARMKDGAVIINDNSQKPFSNGYDRCFAEGKQTKTKMKLVCGVLVILAALIALLCGTLSKKGDNYSHYSDSDFQMKINANNKSTSTFSSSSEENTKAQSMIVTPQYMTYTPRYATTTTTTMTTRTTTSKETTITRKPKIKVKPWMKYIGINMDTTKRACDDFYHYACGGWEKKVVIPTGKKSWNRFKGTRRHVYRKLKRIFDSGNLVGEAERKAKQFFTKCLNERRSDRYRALNLFRTYLASLKVTPLLTSYTSLSEIKSLIPKIHQHGVWPLFKVSARTHQNDTSKQILTVSSGIIPYVSESLSEFYKDALTTSLSKHEKLSTSSVTKLQKFLDKQETKYTAYTSLLVENLLNKIVFMKIWKTPTKSYFCRLYKLGCTNTDAESLTSDVLDLELDILKAMADGLSLSSRASYSKSDQYEIITIRQLQRRCGMMNWRTYFSELMNLSVSLNTEIMVIGYHFQKICDVVTRYMAYSYSAVKKKRALSNYLLLTLAKSLLNHYDTHIILDTFDRDSVEYYNANHQFNCLSYTNKAFGIATGSMYLRQMTSTQRNVSIRNVNQIISYVKQAYKSKIFSANWLDETTKRLAKSKIDHMLDKVGFDKDVTNVTYRDIYYQKFQVTTSDWFDNIVAWKKFETIQSLNDVREPTNRKRPPMLPATVNARNILIKNSMELSMALFQLPFYSMNRPMVMNFGAIGSVIGHELTHAFDRDGATYDKYGRIKKWLTPASERLLKQKSECLKNQYRNFRLQGYKSNPNTSLGEDISDNGAIRAAYFAYQLWKNDHEDRNDTDTISWINLHNLTDNQLFFIAYAQVFSEKFTQKGLKSLTSNYSPGLFRIKGPLSNTEFFQNAFSCTPGSAYAPVNRCLVW